MQYVSLGQSAYETLRFSLLSRVEDTKPIPYLDGNGYITIGVGFNLHDAAVRDAMLAQWGILPGCAAYTSLLPVQAQQSAGRHLASVPGSCHGRERGKVSVHGAQWEEKERKTVRVGWLSALVAASSMATTFASGADALMAAPNAAKSMQKDCYSLVPLRGPAPRGDYPSCQVVLRNLNKSCGEGPQYDERKVDLASKDIAMPAWRRLDPSKDLELVKNIYLAEIPAISRDAYWRDAGARVLSLARENKIQLFRADINVDAVGGVETVYMLKNLYPPVRPENRGGNQNRYMITELNSKELPKTFASYFVTEPGDLWMIGNQWYLTMYDVSRTADVTVKLISNPTVNTPGYVARCDIQYRVAR